MSLGPLSFLLFKKDLGERGRRVRVLRIQREGYGIYKKEKRCSSMPLQKVEAALARALEGLEKAGTLKGEEWIITGVAKAKDGRGPRYLIQGQGEREFLRMNSNSYLGMSLREELLEAEEEGARKYGVGPGAVRFIHGTFLPHVELEKRLADFHGKEAAMIFSSAYAANCGVLAPLISKKTVVLSDALNHNSIINAIRLSRPQDKEVYKHLDMEDLEGKIKSWIGRCDRLLIITDGVFSMRGDYVDLSAIVGLGQKYNEKFSEGALTVVDDSHGTGAFGETGRGTIEVTRGEDVDIITSTLGKAFGVNGGYLASSEKIIEYLRETSPFYIYSNPITPSEASAVLRAIEILDSQEGAELLKGLKEKTQLFERGLLALGFEILEGEHPIVPVMVRDTQKTEELVEFLKERGILVVGLKFPVVPKGDESLRFQISASHTKNDIEYVLEQLKEYSERRIS